MGGIMTSFNALPGPVQLMSFFETQFEASRCPVIEFPAGLSLYAALEIREIQLTSGAMLGHAHGFTYFLFTYAKSFTNTFLC